MKSKKSFYFSTSFAAFFMAVFMIGSISQSTVTPEKSISNEPSVLSTSPSDGEEDVPRNVVIEVTFSETMESTSLQNSTFTLKQGTETVEGTFEYSGNKGMFTTEKSLKAETEYTASLSMGNSQLDNNQSDNDYSNNESNNDNEFNDDYSENEFNHEENEENYHANNHREWAFTTGGNSEPVETVDLGSAANYVILAQTSIQNDSSSEITGERGFDPEFKSSKDKKSAYWLKNEDVDKEEVRRNKEETRKDKEEAHKNKDEERRDKEATRRDDNREKSDSREYSATESDTNAGNLDEALEDMISAYNDAAERTPVDFVDYKFLKSDDQAESTWNNDRDDRNEKDSRELKLEEDYQDDSQEEYQRDDEEEYHAESEMDHNRTHSEMDHNRADSELDRNRNESSVTLEPGIYKWNDSVELSSNITLSGNADDVWIFQISDGLTVNRDVEITLGSGVVAENVIWQVAGDVNIGEASHFEGIILSLTGITMKSGASLNGRLLAQTDITLDENTIMEPQVFASVQRTSLDE